MPDDTTAPAEGQPKPKRNPGDLVGEEVWWSNRQPWLQEQGYILRPRFRQGWVPSWIGTNKSWSESEDGLVSISRQIIDAIRVSDGKPVALKKVSKSIHPTEASIGHFFSAEPLAADPDNHCVPLYKVLQVPDEDDIIILVMPFLRRYNSPSFEAIGEAVDFFSQSFVGLHFMHKHLVAHRDVNANNIMMDATAMYPGGFHPHTAYQDLRPDFKGSAKRYSRAQKSPKYYWIDFGISSQYKSLSPPPREERLWGGDRTVPEFQDNPGSHDPFPVDVYNIGNLIKLDFIQSKRGFEFMEDLVADMTQDDPTKRPTMDVVVARFDKIRQSLPKWTLRTRVAKKKEPVIVAMFRGSRHAIQQAGYMLRGTPPVPFS